jgi:hypothetical protein
VVLVFITSLHQLGGREKQNLERIQGWPLLPSGIMGRGGQIGFWVNFKKMAYFPIYSVNNYIYIWISSLFSFCKQKNQKAIIYQVIV